MKKILIMIGFALSTVFSTAQQVQLEETPPNWPLMLSNLNQTQITAGFLYNKTAMFSVLNNYNIGNYNVSHADHFKQAINELHYASDSNLFISANQLKAAIASTPANFVDIGIVNTTITTLNFNEKDPALGGLTFPVDRFVPIAGRPAFLTRKILLAAPLKEMMVGTSVTYNFANNLIFNNAASPIKNLVVYFNDATPVTIINNGELAMTSIIVNYATSGTKMLKFVATFTDNTSITTSGYHFFTFEDATTFQKSSTAANFVSPCDYKLKDRTAFKSTIAFRGYDEPVGYYGKFDETIFYHTNNGNAERKMLKPIIIIDGFDPGDKRKTTDCDCEQDKSEGGCFEKNSTASSLFFRTFNPISHESIEENMLYDVTNPISGLNEPKNLITTLRELGYDVIILNIPSYLTSAEGSTTENKAIDGGADYIERNGRALASYLRATKSKLVTTGSSEQIAIMGPSMGGLISRYALAYMEKKFAETNDNSWKHNTKLWVSFDSPHLGANIPMGAQANIWFLGNKLRSSKADDKFNYELNSVAGKQMLIGQFQHTLNTMTNNVGQSNNSPFFNQFQTNLNSNGVSGSGGFPVSVPDTFRKIAIVNGSLNGTKNGIDGGEFLNVRGYYDPTFWGGLASGAVVGSVFPFVGTVLGAITGALFGASNANVTLLRCKDNFYPGYGQSGYIFEGDGQNFKIGFNQWYINHKWYKLRGNNFDIRGSLDVVPAGTFTTGKILREQIVAGLDEAGLSNEVRGTTIDTHSFIPAFSALAHLQPYQNWSSPLNSNLVCASNKQTPFDSYYGVNANTPHISLTKEMVSWLLKELNGDKPAPYFPVDPSVFIGDNTMCENQPKTYQFNDLCKIPGKATFSVTGNLVVTSFTDYAVTVTSANGGGAATIIADFGNGVKVEKEVFSGKPSFQFRYNYFDQQPVKSTLCVDSDIPSQSFAQQSVTSIVFSRGVNNTVIMGVGNCRRTTNPWCIKATVTNACGSTTQLYECDLNRASAPNTLFKIYPNPSKDIVTIDLRDENNAPDKGATISGELYDIMGTLRSKVAINQNKATFSVLGLNKGIYVLKIYINDQLEAHQIAVE